MLGIGLFGGSGVVKVFVGLVGLGDSFVICARVPNIESRLEIV